MTGFVIGAALLVVTALAFLLPPLLRKDVRRDADVARDELNLAVLRDQLRELDADLEAGTVEQSAYESARRDLEQRVAEEVQPQERTAETAGQKRWMAAAVGVAVPVVAVSIYLMLGSPAALDPAMRTAAAGVDGNGNGHEITQEQIEGMVAKLAARLQTQPDDVEGWNMLARSYNALGNFAMASEAYAHLVTLIPDDAGVLADYADTLAMATNRSLQGEPEKLIERALAVDGKNIKALALAGSAAFERKDYAVAVQRWQRILPLVAPDSDIARSTSGSISEAKGLMGQGGVAAQASAPEAAPAAAAASAFAGKALLEGVVELDPSLRAQVADTDVVYIFARAARGPRFPLAVLRKQVKDLPVKFSLDDSMGMMPNVKLSDFPTVVVGARISKTGNATPAPGDLEGEINPVAPDAKNLKIRIDRKNG